MKKLLNKALLYKEWKSCKWFMFTFALIDAFFIMIINTGTSRLRNDAITGFKASNMVVNNYSSLWIMIFIPLVICATTLAGEEFSGKKYEIFSAMPFRREEIVVSKWIMGTMTFLFPLLITYLMLLVNFKLNKDILSGILSYGIIFKWLIFNALEFSFVFTFIMLIEFLTGKNILGGILGIIFLFLPLGLFMLLAVNTQFIGKYIKIEPFERASENTSLVLYNMDGIFSSHNSFLAPELRIIILAAAIIICLLLSIYAFKKYPLENIGSVIAFKKLELIFKIGVSICFGLLFSSIYNGFSD
jgi:ABC-type transport system involved in multi-copper enzyme maturation permease subunit